MIHFWDLPNNRIHIKLKEEFKKRFIKELFNHTKTIKNASKMTGYSINTIRRMREDEYKVKIETVVKISKLLDKKEFSLPAIEKNVTWVGHPLNYGIETPKLPFSFASRHGARFVAAIFNDGTIARHYDGIGRMMYDNFNKRLRESVKRDLIETTGGDIKSLIEVNTEKKKYIAFPSIFRDILITIVEPGPKSEANQAVPKFVLENKSCMLGWLEQTIADEGEVKYYPEKYRRSIIWRRSVDITDKLDGKVSKKMPIGKMSKELQGIVANSECRLITDELRMLKKLGIDHDLYNLGIYLTASGKVRTIWQISITKRKNLTKLRKMIKIPHKEKDDKFSRMIKGFVRYKESLRPRKAVLCLGKGDKRFTSTDLKSKMGYKQINTAIKWLVIIENEGIIKKVKESTYGEGGYRKPAEYVLTRCI